MDGVLIVDKPPRMTSHDVVDHVRRKLGTRRVGHAGTLDPDATGILVLGLGRATRFLSFAQDAPKRYVAGALFGRSTTTQDASGETVATAPARFARDDLESAASAFVGTIEQVPPMVSAVKVGGERLYKKARRGEDVERAPRPVTIHELEVDAFRSEADVADATLNVLCSAGTYVRTLIHDLGAALGCGAHMTSLRRVEMGGFSLAEAVPLDDVEAGHVRPMIDTVRVLPRIDVDEEARSQVAHGRPLEGANAFDDGTAVALAHEGELIAVYRGQGADLVAERVVPS